MIFTLCLNCIFALSSYNLQTLTTSSGKKYKKCNMNKSFGHLFYYIIQIYEVFIILISLILIFIEWSLKETRMDVKYIATALFFDIISLYLLNIIDKVKFKDYVIYSTLLAITILIFSGSNHFFIYIFRVLPMFRKKDKYKNSKESIKKKSNSAENITKEPSNLSSFFHKALNKNSFFQNALNKNSAESGTIIIKTTSSSFSKINEITKKIMNYHNLTDISGTSETLNMPDIS